MDDDETFLGIAQPILEANDLDVKLLNSVFGAETPLINYTPDLIISYME